jgi:hypothetical protein
MTFPTELEARAFVASFLPGTGDAVAVIPTTHGYWTLTSPVQLKRPANVCSICGESFREPPCNARPVNDGGCCAYCDDHVVTPVRIAAVRQ